MTWIKVSACTPGGISAGGSCGETVATRKTQLKKKKKITEVIKIPTCWVSFNIWKLVTCSVWDCVKTSWQAESSLNSLDR